MSRARKGEWANESNLILMSKRRLMSLAPAGAVVEYTGLRLGPWSSNLLLFIDDARTSRSSELPRA